MLIKRLIFSALIIAAAVYFVFFSPLPIYILGLEVIIFLCLNEFFTMVERKGLAAHKTLGLIVGALLPLNVFFPLEPLVILLAILVLFLLGFDKNSKTVSTTLPMTAMTIFGVIYISWLLCFFVKLRLVSDNGSFWVFFVVLIAKMGDTGAYFIGKAFGRHKLIQHVSPSKSVEGAVGSAVVTILTALLSKVYLPEAPLIHLLILGVAVSILAQLGDLAESLIKRNLDTKDSGVIPGLGGMLDIMDSLLFSVPFVYYYIKNVPGIIP